MISRLSPHPDPPSRQPHRVRMAHNLIVNYGLYRDLEVFVRGGHGEEVGRAVWQQCAVGRWRGK